MRGVPRPERARRLSAAARSGHGRAAAGVWGAGPTRPRGPRRPGEAAGRIPPKSSEASTSGGPGCPQAHLGPDLVSTLARLDVHNLPHGDARLASTRLSRRPARQYAAPGERAALYGL